MGATLVLLHRSLFNSSNSFTRCSFSFSRRIFFLFFLLILLRIPFFCSFILKHKQHKYNRDTQRHRERDTHTIKTVKHEDLKNFDSLLLLLFLNSLCSLCVSLSTRLSILQPLVCFLLKQHTFIYIVFVKSMKSIHSPLFFFRCFVFCMWGFCSHLHTHCEHNTNTDVFHSSVLSIYIHFIHSKHSILFQLKKTPTKNTNKNRTNSLVQMKSIWFTIWDFNDKRAFDHWF